MPTKSVLIIEQDPSVGEVLSISLREFGSWQVILYNSIQEGIQACQVLCPDVILLDASLSEIDALIFLEQLKQHSITQSIPIVLMSARATWFTLEQLQQMGFAGAIAKPFKPTALAAYITQLLSWEESD